MEKRDLFGREEIINNEPNDREMKPLLVPTQPIYVKFRQGRETLAPVKSSEFALNVFKVCFSSVGLWNHQAWNFIPRVLLATVCLYQVSYSLYFDVLDKCRLNYKNETEKEKIAMEHSTYTEHIAEALLNVASVSSFLVFTGCFMVAKRKRSACVLPSLSTIENNDRKITLTLFAFFIFTTLLLASAIGLLYNTSIEIKLVEGSFCRHILVAAIAVQFLLHWVALNICHIFAFSSLALEIYEKVNCSTSDDWNEGHPFKDRNNISLFVSYAEKRRCGFKAGRITFDATLAWVSFAFGVIAALFRLIQHGYLNKLLNNYPRKHS